MFKTLPAMPKNNLKEILDLSTEEGVAAAMNLVKSSAKGFSSNTIKGVAATTLSIKDSASERDASVNNLKAQALESEVEESEVEVPSKASIDDESKDSEIKSQEAETTETQDAVLSASDIQQMILSAMSPLLEENRSLEKKLNEATEAKKSADLKISELGDQLKSASRSEEVLEHLGKLAGRSVALESEANKTHSKGKVSVNLSAPAVNRYVAANSDRMDGALRDFWSIRDASPKTTKCLKSGRFVEVADNSQLRHFVRQNRQALIKDVESYAKSNGLLSGKSGNLNLLKDATSAADILGGFLPTLSAIMRENNRPGYIFHQFPNTRIEYDQGMGDTIQIPRAAFQPPPSSPEDRLLSGGGVYRSIDSGNQSLSTGTVTAILNEWGLGADSSAPPVGLPAFVRSYSMTELMQILERNIQQDYWRWEDLYIRSFWARTSRVVYNDNAVVTTTPGDVGANDNGTFTDDFAYELHAYGRELEIPTFADERYGYACPTRHISQLRKSYSDRFQLATEADVQNITNMLNTATGGELDRVTGYQGVFGNLHIFETNAYGTGAPGSEGVQTETFGTGAVTTRTGYLFGADTLGRGIGTEMEILFEDSDFSRMTRAIWKSEEVVVAMDVDPTGYADTSEVPQQLRVVAVRTSDTAQ